MRHAKPKHGDISDPVAGRRPGTAGATHLAPPRCGAAGAPPLPATRDTLQTAAAVTGNARTTGALPAATGRQAGRPEVAEPRCSQRQLQTSLAGQSGKKKHEASFATQPMGSCHAAKACKTTTTRAEASKGTTGAPGCTSLHAGRRLWLQRGERPPTCARMGAGSSASTASSWFTRLPEYLAAIKSNTRSRRARGMSRCRSMSCRQAGGTAGRRELTSVYVCAYACVDCSES